MPAITCDPNGLANLARCFTCLDPFTLNGITTFLLCQWANGHSPVVVGQRIDEAGNFLITETGDTVGV